MDELMETYLNVSCPACGIVKKKIKARTMSGAIRRTAVLCRGIQLTSNGVNHTRCYNIFAHRTEG
jgi:hypothetical protein